MKKGHPSIEQTIGLPKIRKAYEASGFSARATAKALGVSRKAMLKVVHRHGWDKEEPPAFRAGNVKKHLAWDSKVLDWIKENPEKSLPRSYREIGRIVRASHETVRQWYINENERIREQLMKLPDLRGLNLTLIDGNNMVYSSDELVTYKFLINRWTFESKLVGTVEDPGLEETTTRIFPIDNLKEFMRRVRAVATQRAIDSPESGRRPGP